MMKASCRARCCRKLSRGEFCPGRSLFSSRVWRAMKVPGFAVALIRATRGLVFIKEMDLGEFYERSRALKQAAENR